MESRQATEQRRAERQVLLVRSLPAAKREGLPVRRAARGAVQHDYGQALHRPISRDRSARGRGIELLWRSLV